ncbi:MAG: Hsp20/alpha crystallin family protein [Solirubrobacterales bacterium]|nr:Hsp20/alpha crystallin family protein [Solirubrobacterales bacterium]
MREKDLFANFARMRREMDEMLGGTWGRATYISRRASGFSPSVDVYYANDPERAVIKCELAGIDLSTVGIEVSGRQVTVIGHRPVQETEGRVFQQVEIPTGPFRCIVELQVDVDAERAEATYEDGLLTVDLPLRAEEERVRQVPVQRG